MVREATTNQVDVEASVSPMNEAQRTVSIFYTAFKTMRQPLSFSRKLFLDDEHFSLVFPIPKDVRKRLRREQGILTIMPTAEAGKNWVIAIQPRNGMEARKHVSTLIETYNNIIGQISLKWKDMEDVEFESWQRRVYGMFRSLPHWAQQDILDSGQDPKTFFSGLTGGNI